MPGQASQPDHAAHARRCQTNQDTLFGYITRLPITFAGDNALIRCFDTETQYQPHKDQQQQQTNFPQAVAGKIRFAQAGIKAGDKKRQRHKYNISNVAESQRPAAFIITKHTNQAFNANHHAIKKHGSQAENNSSQTKHLIKSISPAEL